MVETAQFGRKVFHGAAPLEFAVDVRVEAVFFLDRSDGGANHVDFGQIILTEAHLATVDEIAGPGAVDTHRFEADTVRSDVIGGGDGEAGRNGSAGGGAVAFHAVETINDRGAPEGTHLLRGEEHVVLHLADADVIFALVAPMTIIRSIV